MLHPVDSHKGNTMSRKLRIDTGGPAALWHFSEEAKQKNHRLRCFFYFALVSGQYWP